MTANGSCSRVRVRKKTQSTYIEKLLKIDKLINGYTSADEADRSKPAPDIFTASLEKLDGVVPDDGIAVGDTRFDIEAAAKAGLNNDRVDLSAEQPKASCAPPAPLPSTATPPTSLLATIRCLDRVQVRSEGHRQATHT